MRLPSRLMGLSMIVFALALGALSGCSPGVAIDEAYARGYADGVDSVEGQLIAVETAYDNGYQDGLADAVERQNAELCQRCYGLGFSEGYQAGVATSGASAAS